ncbi:MAG: hypothetical protein OXI66_17730 [Boseongicola sp.]|nr:hypothetical protein [Boseongicola sp.]
MKHSQRLAFLVGRASMELAGVSVILAAPAQAGKRVRFVKAERLVSVT